MTVEKKKEEAIVRMGMLKLAPKVIEDFSTDEKLYQSFRNALAGGTLLELTNFQKEKIHSFEVEHDCLVYHVIHDYTGFGEMLTLLYVSNYSDEWKQDRMNIKEGFPMAYVINLDNDICSEFGLVGVEPHNGRLLRTE